MDLLSSANKLLVVAPHPDDESLSCGGLLSRWKRNDKESFVLILNSETDDREVETHNSANILGYKVLISPFQNKQGLDGANKTSEFVSYFEKVLAQMEPDVVCLPNLLAYHQDHRIAGLTSLIAMRPNGSTSRWRPNMILESEYCGDAWPPRSELTPSLYVQLTEEDLVNKISSYSQHVSQIRAHPSERSVEAIRALAQVRGSQSGVELAEAYRVLYMKY